METEKPIDIDQLDWIAVPTQLQDGPHNRPLSKRQLRTWSLVLQSRAIPWRSERVGHGWQLLVPVAQYRTALEELRSYEQANRNWPPPLPEVPPEQENTVITIWILIALGLFHILTQKDLNLFGSAGLDWYAAGTAHAGKILAGDWWRLITALTLHSGGLHLAGNFVVGGLFVNRLCRDLGAGLGWLLVLLSGLLGNLLNAFVQAAEHRSIGASTAVFGAVGLLAVLNMLRYRQNLRHRWPLPIAAACGLLALLGASGENTDIGAHLFGFGCGLLLGLATDRALKHFGRPSQRLSYLLGTMATGLVIGCWLLALRA